MGEAQLGGQILWRIDPFLGGDCEANNETTFAARQRLGKRSRGNGYAWNNRGTAGNGVHY
jgi:hypothetical protein